MSSKQNRLYTHKTCENGQYVLHISAELHPDQQADFVFCCGFRQEINAKSGNEKEWAASASEGPITADIEEAT